MYKIHYKKSLNEKIAAKCARHPRYDPEEDGREGIKERCSTCFNIFDLYDAKLRMDRSIQDFLKRAAAWTVYRPTRKKAAATGAEEISVTDEATGN